MSAWNEQVSDGQNMAAAILNVADAGEQKIALELDPPEQVATWKYDPTPEPELDAAGDAPADQGLETIRRAAVLDLADPDTLPEF